VSGTGVSGTLVGTTASVSVGTVISSIIGRVGVGGGLSTLQAVVKIIRRRRGRKRRLFMISILFYNLIENKRTCLDYQG
jgi:Ca2+/Na+ antiporter